MTPILHVLTFLIFINLAFTYYLPGPVAFTKYIYILNHLKENKSNGIISLISHK